MVARVAKVEALEPLVDSMTRLGCDGASVVFGRGGDTRTEASNLGSDSAVASEGMTAPTPRGPAPPLGRPSCPQTIPISALSRLFLLLLLAPSVAGQCADDPSWTTAGSYTYDGHGTGCAWFAANDPGCTQYGQCSEPSGPDYNPVGQCVGCPGACGLCPASGSSIASLKAWKNSLPALSTEQLQALQAFFIDECLQCPSILKLLLLPAFLIAPPVPGFG